MAMQVVDRLEAVQVDVDDGQRASMMRRGVERCVEALQKGVAVEQAGQGVVAGEVPNACLITSAVGQIAQHDDSRGLAEIVNWLAGQFHRDLGPIDGLQSYFLWTSVKRRAAFAPNDGWRTVPREQAQHGTANDVVG